MGQLFQRTYRAADGSVKTCRTWTLRYYRNGRPMEESTKYTRKGDAQTLLKLRDGDLAKGMPISPAQFKLTFEDAAKTVVNDFTANGKKSLKVVQRRIDKHLTPWFGGRRLSEISADFVLAFIAKRQKDRITIRKARGEDSPAVTKPVSNAEIIRELQVLKRCFSLALKHGKIFTKPAIPKLKEAAARSGFFDRAQVDAVSQHLSPVLAAVVRFAFITGWRIPSEVLTLEWRQLEPGMTKNGEGREFKITTALREVLESRLKVADDLKRTHGLIVARVFFRMVAKGRRGEKSPKPIRAFNKAFTAACVAAGCPGRIPHDFRRSAVRTFVRAGISERVAMQMSGHRTRSVFDRYNIVSETDLTEAATKLNAVDRDSSVTVAPKRGARRSAFKQVS
jgi:integrase